MSLDWHDTLEGALGAADSARKPVLVDFWSEG
jgi:hypothetical protein